MLSSSEMTDTFQESNTCIDVFSATSKMGILCQQGDQYSFTFDNLWEYGNCPPYPSLQYQKWPHVSQDLFPVFLDACPDGWGTRLLQYATRLHSKTVLTPFDIFQMTDNTTREGAIEAGSTWCNIHSDADMEELVQACRQVEECTDPNKAKGAISLLVNNGIGIGGARPKFNYVFDDALWICKCPSIEDTYNVTGWEALNLTLARLAGINVPEFQYIPELNVLMVRRFDRDGINKLPYVSARTLLSTEYSNYATLAAYCDPDDRKELFKRMVLNAFVGNFDDHLRNFGFLYLDGVWRLSPVFDIETIPVEEDFRYHTTKINFLSAYSDIDNILRDIGNFCILEDEARSCIRLINNIIQINLDILVEKYHLKNDYSAVSPVYKYLLDA